MADEKLNHTWAKSPTLKKIKIGDKDYWLKDEEAREVVDAVEAGLASEVSRATTAEGSLQAAISAVATDLAAEVSARESADEGLDKRIQALEGRGRFLSSWDCTTGKPGDYPSIEVGGEYAYKAGDYYLVSKVGASGNLRPDGTKIQHTAESTWVVPSKAETETVAVGDEYLYSTSGWVLIHTEQKQTTWGSIGGTLSNQTDLQNALNAKVDKVTGKSLVDDTEITKLEGVEANAEKNIIEIVKVDGSALSVDATDRSVNVVGISSLRADLSAEITARTSADTALGNRIKVYEDNKDHYDEAYNKAHSHANKEELDLIASGDKAKWDAAASIAHSHSNKTVLDGIAADNLLDATGSASKSKLSGIEAGAQVNIVEKIKVGDTVHTADASKVIDLGDIALTSGVVTNVESSISDNVITLTKTIGSNKTNVQVFGKLANKDSASGTVPGQTISGVTGTVTAAGSIAVTLSQTSTTIQSSGSVTASGTVNVTLNNNQASKLATAGSVAAFTEGAFTPNVPTEIDVTKFNAGATATYSHTGFSGGSLGEATKATFASEGIKAHVGASTTVGEDVECLYFEAAGTAQAVVAQGSFTAAVYGTDSFNGGTLPSLEAGFYKAGSAASKASDTFRANVLPTFDAVTVGVASATFTGSEVAVNVSGNYDKASINTATFTGSQSTVAVGTITVESKTVTVE